MLPARLLNQFANAVAMIKPKKIGRCGSGIKKPHRPENELERCSVYHRNRKSVTVDEKISLLAQQHFSRSHKIFRIFGNAAL